MEDLYPLKMQPVFKEYAWGGKAIRNQYKKNTPYTKTAESWEVSVQPQGTSLVLDGVHAGVSLEKMVKLWGEDLCGTLHEEEDFPLTFKLVDAGEWAPLQVHPDDVYAAENTQNSSGKTEMCYVLAAKSDAQIAYGFSRDITAAELGQALQNGELGDIINRVEVEEGDVLFIPSGIVHAIGKGVTVAEIQQSSNVTYMFGESETEEIVKVSELESSVGEEKAEGLPIETEDYIRYKLCCCRYFGAEKVELDGVVPEETDGRSFHILFCTSGDAVLRWGEMETEMEKGDTFLIPAALGDYEIEGDCEYLKYYIPEFAKDFLEPLLEAGYGEDEVISLLY
ncbi:MAG: hypothetical protein HFI90_09620 [Clostridia bacterium]|nr:hypothetical protein [Clostridia bacterium]